VGRHIPAAPRGVVYPSHSVTRSRPSRFALSCSTCGASSLRRSRWPRSRKCLPVRL